MIEPEDAYPPPDDFERMEAWQLALRIVLLGLSVIMLGISAQAWRRARGRRMVWVMVSFAGFVLLSSSTLLGAIWGDSSWAVPDAIVGLLILIIGAIYLALLKG
jgi:uncharacterized membrane protein